MEWADSTAHVVNRPQPTSVTQHGIGNPVSGWGRPPFTQRARTKPPLSSDDCAHRLIEDRKHMTDGIWTADERARFEAIRDALAEVSTASACQLMINRGWRNGYMLGLKPLQPLERGVRLVGRARTCRYLMRRGPEGPHDPVARKTSPEIVLIESIQPGDVF